ncbi:MAG: isochorismatase family protein [Gemmataceae bacterium]
MNHSLPRLRIENSVLIVIDIQTKLLAKIPRAERLVRDAGFLLDVAALLHVPVRATEQYPKGLGGTHPDILRRVPGIIEKTAFSCCGAGTFLEELQMLQRPNAVLVGMEAHVCVQQTALDLIEAGIHVFLPVDAVESRGDVDRETALRRMERAGAVPTTVEAVAFEWLRDSTHPQFKAASKLVIERGA